MLPLRFLLNSITKKEKNGNSYEGGGEGRKKDFCIKSKIFRKKSVIFFGRRKEKIIKNKKKNSNISVNAS